MNRDAALAAALALLALLALGVAAATLDDPVLPAGDGLGADGGPGGLSAPEEDRDEPSGGLPIDLPGRSGRLSGLCLTWLESPLATSALFLLVLLPAAYVSYRTRWLLPGVALALAIGGPVLLVWLALTSCQPGTAFLPFPDISWGLGFGSGAGGGGGGGDAPAAASRPSLVLGVLLVVAVGGALLLLFVSTGSAEERPADSAGPSPPRPTPDITALGFAAGRAADRIDADGATAVGNEVYRAWVEMTDHLSVAHPESSTPAEFADAAVAAGMTEGDVRELTTLFEETRYGGRTPTEEQEARAVAALRRIESAYADEDRAGGEPTGRREPSR